MMHLAYCLEAAKLHAEIGPEILELAKESARFGEPILRHLAYDYPNHGYEDIKDQFLLGDNILVAPIISKGARTRNIKFPPCIWNGDDGSKIQGPCSVKVEVPLSRLPWYRKEY
jgi:alpha-glucosidase (family GH31 glycosyl hydrolase)